MAVSCAHISVVGLALALAGCSGSGSGISSTPPPPAPTYSAFPLSKQETLAATISTRSYAGDLGFDQVTVSGSSTGRAGVLTVGYDPATGTYSLRDDNYAQTFSASDRNSLPSDPPETRYAKRAGTVSDALNIFDNIALGGDTTTSPVQLTYLSYGNWLHTESDSGEHRSTWFLIGRPTLASDMPKTGSASYTSAVQGDGITVAGNGFGGSAFSVTGSATFTANFSNGAIDTGLELHQVQFADNPLIGMFKGSGTISTGTGDFGGSFTSTDSPFSGSFLGSFYGPAAKEVGYTFALSGHQPGGLSGTDTYINGVVIGTKK